MWQWLLIPFAYLMGSLSSAVIISRVMQLPDPREEGSKNPGATNVLRLGGKKAAALTLAGDLIKGLTPVLIANGLAVPAEIVALVGATAFIGHLYPIFFGFKGGKGVATALGVLTGFFWPIGLSLAATWGLTVWIFRISSLSALISATLAPVYVWFWLGLPVYVVASVGMSALLIWRHRNNIQRLIKGEESRVGR
jgi:glycerol-3-phosphate acyltransferase PlsY